MLRTLVAVLRLSLALWLGALRAVLFLVRTPQGRRREARLLREQADAGGRPVSPLVAELDSVYRVAPSFFGSRAGDVAAAPILIYFAGTAETPHAPLPAYRTLIEACPDDELLHCRHYVVDAPFSKGAYYGSSAFSSRVWQHVSALVANEPGPFVLVGLSRGALTALEVGARIAEEHNKVASVLALSPPLAVPRRLPASVVQIAAFEDVAEILHRDTADAPPWLARFVTKVVRDVYVRLTSVIHVELAMKATDDFHFALLDVDVRGATECSVRGAREFRLLVHARDRELEHFANRVAACAARSPRFFAYCAWGRNDAWAEPERCLTRIEAARRREGATEARLVARMLDGRGHSLFRERGKDVREIAALLSRVSKEARAMHDGALKTADQHRSFEVALYRDGERKDRHD